MSARCQEWSPFEGRDIVRLVDIETHVKAIQEHGVGLADAAERAGLDAKVPTCPDWTIRDLVAHQGMVHRWAAGFVATGATDPNDVPLTEGPGNEDLMDWFREGHAGLVDAINRAPADLECWAFLRAPSPLAFWARRQAHETTIHRADAESANGQTLDVEPALAVDGIDELLLGFYARKRGQLVADPALSLGLHATDARPDDAWSVVIGADGRDVTRGGATGDCLVSSTASKLYQFLWNRRSRDALTIQGDVAVLDLWQEKARITWG
jgi:uncharacterized protein (TIGR03083 family)